MLTTMQVKEYLNLGSVFKVYEMMRSKKLRFHKFGGRTIRFDPDELDEDIQKFKFEAVRPK